MKILRLDIDVEPTNKDVFYNLNQLVASYGKEFYVHFKNRRIPFIVKRRLFKPKDNMPQKAIYKLSIAYTQTTNMHYPTLNMSVGDDDDTPESGHIDYVHRNDEHDLSGTFIVDLAIAFMKFLAVKEVTLTDAARANDGSNKCAFPLAPYLLLKKKTTFYGKWGFKPQQSLYNTSFEDDKAKHKRLCQVLSKLQKIQVKDMLTLLNKMKTTLVSIKDVSILITYDIMIDFETGVMSYDDYDDDWDKKSLEQLLNTIDKTVTHLSPYDKNTIHEMVQTCTCLQFQSLMQFVSFYNMPHNSKIPSTIDVGKKKITNKYSAMFREFNFILSMGSYILDLTAKPSKTTCL
jgi:hypothetical protein